MKIHNLKVNGIREPLGYSFEYLTFSWEISAVRLPQDAIFTVEVAHDELFENILLKKTTTNSFNNLTVKSDFLKPRTRYYWRVSVEEIKSESFFETGKLSEPWLAHWISYQEEAIPCVRFYKNLSLPNKKVRSARLYALGLGLYEVALDNHKIGHEYLSPGYHSYDLIQQYQTYDVTNLLQAESELSFLVGNGWYRGRFVFEGGFENIYGDKQKLIAELHIDYEDGSHGIITSDNTWNVESSLIQENSIYDGEVIDYSADIKVLKLVELNDSQELLEERIDPSVVLLEEFKPRIFYDKANQLILDFGQEISGWLCGEIPAGKEKVTFQFSELLQDGVFYRDNLRTAKQEFKVLNTKQTVEVRPHFTYFGFRYVKVTGLSLMEAEKFSAKVLQSEMDDTFEFDSSHEKLNQLLQNIKWSQKDNFVSIPTDCPQRDERMGWTGDITVFSNTASYNMETRAFLEHYLKNLRLEQKQLDGKVPFFAPYPKISPFEGINPFLTGTASAVWGDAITVLPITLYKHYHDKGILQANVEAMVAWVDSIYKEDEAKGSKRLWHFGMQLGDWLALDTKIPGCVMGATDSVLIASVYYYLSAKNTAEALKILNDDRADFYYQLSSEIKQAMIDSYFYCNELIDKPATLQSEVEQIRQGMMQAFVGVSIDTHTRTQTGLAMLLRYGIYPNEKAKNILTTLLAEEMEKNDGFLTTGFAGTPELPHALLENNLADKAFELLFKEAAPSWLFEVNMGAMTTWERWDSILPNGKISGTDMNSLNHYAYGAVEDFVIEKILGFNLPNVRDEQAIYHIQPYYTDYLSWVNGKLKTPNGYIELSWEKEKSSILIEIEVPTRTTVEFIKLNGETIILNEGKNIIVEVES
ncbi:alpha-L-rhamnosidase [Streptococcus gallolyticus]|uniref:alpha-L-rhamnosidase n=1 Tax=Streptococcus gallolyticus TaxID=315405 RepID=A0A1H7UPX8_9STRE|nr:family 78 glycoside hydrolase catalytic domain [Streptococcus gallolyticus]SEF19087.1 alpha-L-rhamnosidase [Streptococcus gallolyticus]SEL99072.1 alpha-L-rhamnosidase [Streptococcus gallolyticus]